MTYEPYRPRRGSRQRHAADRAKYRAEFRAVHPEPAHRQQSQHAKHAHAKRLGARDCKEPRPNRVAGFAVRNEPRTVSGRRQQRRCGGFQRAS